jgi:hypothetical protein
VPEDEQSEDINIVDDWDYEDDFWFTAINVTT